jgi:nucleoside-diphosphate-sugar epimerase
VRVIVTGGGGFLGRLLVEELQASGGDDIVVIEIAHTEVPGCRVLVGDVAHEELLPDLLAEGPCTIFHLASVVSAEAEADWGRAIEHNVGGMLRLLEACRDSDYLHKVIFTSSVAVFGGFLAGDQVGDLAKQTPSTTYGTTKAIGELLINDATRKGHIDGRSARLPTVIVRPGAPNAAASSFASSVFREPLNGLTAVVPVALDTVIVVGSAANSVAGVQAIAELDGDALGQDRAVGVPGLSVSLAEMLEVLERVGGREARALVEFIYDPVVDALVQSWPAILDNDRGRNLGLSADADLESIIQAYALELSR